MTNKPEPRFYVDGEGKNQITFAKTEKPEDEICDFCLKNDPPFKVYMAKQFTIFPFVFEPEWDACSECSKFIDANDPAGLLKHSTDRVPPNDLQNVKMVQDKFFENLERK